MTEKVFLRPLPSALDEQSVVNHLPTVVESIRRNIAKIGERNPKDRYGNSSVGLLRSI